MSRRTYLFAGIALVALVVLGVGLAVAQESGGPDLPTLTPAELISKVAERAPQVRAVNGDFSWSNSLLGEAGLEMPGGSQGLASFLKDGSGRLWLQEEGARLEAQTPRGDTVVVFDGEKLHVYSSNESTVTEYSLPDHKSEGRTPDTTATLDLTARIQSMITKLAPTASLEVETADVAGRDAYVLVLTPTADNTVFGEARAAFDAEHFLPLRVELFASDSDDPVLAAGFTRVSFDPVEASLFSFTPPPGTSVERKELNFPEALREHLERAAPGEGAEPGEGADPGESMKRTLTLEEARVEAGFDLAVPENSPLPFAGAHVIPAHEGDSPIAVLAYGEGFGTVVVVQTPVTEEQLGELLQGMVPGGLGSGGMGSGGLGSADTSTSRLQSADLTSALGALIQPTTINGRAAFQIDTQLGSAIAWHTGELGVLVAGSVSPADLSAFAALVK